MACAVGCDLRSIEQRDYERYVGLCLNLYRIKIQTADAVRMGVEACVSEAFGKARAVDFFVHTVSDENYGRFLHKSFQAKLETRKR